MECAREENSKDCPCTWTSCSRRGVCCLCLKHHLAKGELPGCCFSAEAEKTYDRSIDNFIRDYQQRSK
ncbi:MAG TPA: DUF6485 family protein [Candidatus Pacearchaeota archaeon]|nr:DUF6485 family protein [Candidatus Pacearchaeota archaeon]